MPSGPTDTTARNGSGFLVGLARDPGPGSPGGAQWFEEGCGLRPSWSLNGPGVSLALAALGGSLARDEPSGSLLLLHGEIHSGSPGAGGAGGDAAAGLLAAFLDRGPDLLREVDGSFAVVYWEGGEGRLLVATDRWNTRRVFATSRGGVQWLSTSGTLHHLPLPEPVPDPGGIGHFLVNQLPYEGRTLWREVRALPPASLHEVDPRGIRSRRYWTLGLNGELEAVPDAQRMDGLHDRLVAAVQRRTGGAPWLSLSGGWDSRSILGAARAGGVTNLRAFTYGAMGAGADTDAGLAASLAEALHVPHRFIPGYERTLGRVLEDNLRTGGTVQLVMETDAWEGVNRLLDEGDPPVPVLFGDQGVGTMDYPFLRTPADALSSLHIRGLRSLPWLRDLVPASSWGSMMAETEGDLEAILARVPQGLTLQDARYWLFMDVKLARFLGYREFFTQPRGAPRFPLLDRELIEWVCGLPTRDRLGKSLLKRMSALRFPEVFQAKEATDPGPTVGRWFPRRLREEAPEIRRWLRETTSPLDGLLPPDALERLLDGALEGRWEGARARLRRRLHRDLRNRRAGGWIGRRLRLAGGDPTPPWRAAIWALQARKVLASGGR